MSLRTRLAALLKRRQAGEIDRIRQMVPNELDALARQMFVSMAEEVGPEHAEHIRATALWFLDGTGAQHPESKLIVQAVFNGPLNADDLKTINYAG